jgi:hypothetical protein
MRLNLLKENKHSKKLPHRKAPNLLKREIHIRIRVDRQKPSYSFITFSRASQSHTQIPLTTFSIKYQEKSATNGTFIISPIGSPLKNEIVAASTIANMT